MLRLAGEVRRGEPPERAQGFAVVPPCPFLDAKGGGFGCRFPDDGEAVACFQCAEAALDGFDGCFAPPQMQGDVAGLSHDEEAGEVVAAQAVAFPLEAFPFPGEAADDVGDGFPFDGKAAFQSLDGVIPAGEGSALGLQVGKGKRRLLAGVHNEER